MVAEPPFAPHVQLSQIVVSDYKTLCDAVLGYINLAGRELGAVELRTVTARWNSTCRRFGTTVRAVLGDLGARSEIAVHQFDKLGRTYVITKESYLEILEQQKAYATDPRTNRPFDWDDYGKGLDSARRSYRAAKE